MALQEWFTMNHEERFSVQERRIETIAERLAGIPHLNTPRTWERQGVWKRLRIVLDEAALGKTAASIGKALREDDPSIWIHVVGNP